MTKEYALPWVQKFKEISHLSTPEMTARVFNVYCDEQEKVMKQRLKEVKNGQGTNTRKS